MHYLNYIKKHTGICPQCGKWNPPHLFVGKTCRHCRRRPCRSNNRSRNDWLAPAQRLIVKSRLKCLHELYANFPIGTASLEDVRFNHKYKRWGRNFSTVEIGKKVIRNFLENCGELIEHSGYDTQSFRKQYGYKKSDDKQSETFNTHCSDALALAVAVGERKHIEPGRFIIVDDTYRPMRRKLHDTQPGKGGIRDKYSSGNFKGIKKGSISNFGQVCGGIKEKTIRTYDWNNKRLSKALTKVTWLSHRFKTNEV